MSGASADRRTDWLLLAFLCLLWGTAFQFNKLAVAELSPDVIVAVRLVGSAVVLAAAAWWQGERIGLRDRRWIVFFAMAATGNALPFWLISWGQQVVDSGVAGVLMATMPLATVALAHFFVPGERMTRRSVGGFLLGFAGVCLLIGPTELLGLGGDGAQVVRQAAIALAAVCYAVNTILARRLEDTAPVLISACVMIAASTFMLPLSGARAVSELAAVSPTALLSVAWLSAGATALAMLVYYRIIVSAGATFVSQMNFFIPVVAYASGSLFLGEPVEARAVLALGVILAGVLAAR